MLADVLNVGIDIVHLERNLDRHTLPDPTESGSSFVRCGLEQGRRPAEPHGRRRPDREAVAIVPGPGGRYLHQRNGVPVLPRERHVELLRTSRNLAAKASGSPVQPYSPPRNPPWWLGK